jgi:archaellum biogenesis ATPase FlaH
VIAELISRIVSHQELMPNAARLRVEFFEVFNVEWEFLVDYHKQFRTLPNVPTFRGQFPDFPFVDTDRNAQWLLDEVEQSHIDGLNRKLHDEFIERNKVNPRLAAAWMALEVVKLESFSSTNVDTLEQFVRGDLDWAFNRWRHVEGESTSGIPSGFHLLDAETSGTQRGELEMWFARPGEGKSLYLLYGAIAACRAGYRTSYVSPEMSMLEMRARFDAFMLNVSAKKLLARSMSVVEFDSVLSFAQTVYSSLDSWGDLLVREAQGHAGRFTVADCARIIEVDKCDLLVVDGLLFVDPSNMDVDIRKRLTTLMEELKTLSVTTGVPIRLAHQANRKSDDIKTKRKGLLTDYLPDLGNFAEAGAVEQFANKAISIRQLQNRVFLALRKNRNGEAKLFLSFHHDIDRGIISDVRVEDGLAEVARSTTPPDQQPESKPHPF